LDAALVSHATRVTRLESIAAGLTNGDHGGIKYTATGVRYLRGQAVTEFGLDLSRDELYISEEEHVRMQRSEVLPGDVLYTIAGSTGNACVVSGLDRANINQAIVRIRPSNCVDPQYLADFLNSSLGRLQGERKANGGVQLNINFSEVKSLQVIVPSLDIQHRMVAELDIARAERDRALAEAEQLLDSFDNYLLSSLGLTLASDKFRQSFAVRLGAIRGRRFDPPAYQPLLSKYQRPSVPLSRLEELAEINSHSIEKPEDDETLVPYVGLPECDQTEVREVVLRPFREVKGRSVIRPGDILFARIEPSIFNKKYVLVEDLKGYDFAYTSTEFYVVTPRAEHAIGEYLYAMFFCSFVYAQTKGMTTGSSGRRRLDPGLFRSLLIPAPEIGKQLLIAEEAVHRRKKARQLHNQAEIVWRDARARFEQQLLQGGTK
jgi:type I restriction enzyme, S subunit